MPKSYTSRQNGIRIVMKKLLLSVLALGFVFAVSAQGEIRWGVKAGANLSNITSKSDGNKVDESNARFGFHFGGVMEYSFSPKFAFQPELLIVVNGANPEDAELILGPPMDRVLVSNQFIRITQIQIPINLKYKTGTDAMKFFVTAGPYIGYALSGKFGGKMDGASFDSDFYGGSNRRLDFGVGAGIGIEVSKITFGLNYQYGIANLVDFDKYTRKMSSFLFSVGYFF